MCQRKPAHRASPRVGGRRLRRLALTVTLVLIPFLAAACATSTQTATPPPGDLVNDCSYRVSEPTPTPDLKGPTETASASTQPVGSTPEASSSAVAVYPDLPPPALPPPVEAWQEAVVRVAVELAGGRVREQQGLIVAERSVLTVLDLTEEVPSLSVGVSGRGTFAAELERYDPRTGAALLTVDIADLSFAPGGRATVSNGEPVLLLSRGLNGDGLAVKETYASPSRNAPDHIFALRADYTTRTERGTVVVATDGTPVGLAGHGRSWYGRQIVHGRIGGMDLPAVLLASALQLLEFAPRNAGATPAAVTYSGPGLTRHVDGPVTRELLAEPVRAKLEGLGEAFPLENLGRHPRYVLPPNSGTMLEVLYAEPQDLLRADGEWLGSARYIVLWWDREDGAPDLVLCGENREHLGAAFATDGLDSLEALMEGAPSSSPHSMVSARPLPTAGDVNNPEAYQYPYVWDLRPDRSVYHRDEVVNLTLKIANISDWPVSLAHVPPRVTIYSVQEGREVAVLHYGEGHLTLQPGESISFRMEWDQLHFDGGRAEPGRYIAQVQLASLVSRPFLVWGPQADVVLE